MSEKEVKFWALYYYLREKVVGMDRTTIRHRYAGEELEAALYFWRKG